MIWIKARHYHFGWVGTVHLEYRSRYWRIWELLAFQYV